MQDPKHNPRISIIIRFDPKMKQKRILEDVLASRAKEAEAELLQKYPAEQVRPVVAKLLSLMKNADKNAHQSMAFFASPVTEKVIYFTYNPYLSDFNRLHPLRPLKTIEK